MSKKISIHTHEFERSLFREMAVPAHSNDVQMKIAKDALLRAIHTDLTPRQREIILLHYYKDYNVTEIAAHLQLDKSSVSRTLSRAKERLRRSLQFYFDYMNRCSWEDAAD